MKRIIGLDPGLRSMGWGVIGSDGTRLRHIAHGVINSDATRSLALRLRMLAEGLDSVLRAHHPDTAAVETVFVNRDASTSLKLGHARAICLLLPAQHDIEIYEYTPNFIKRAVCGVGHAQKQQIATMIKVLLPRAEVADEHSADALATAIAHAHMGEAALRRADIERATQAVS